MTLRDHLPHRHHDDEVRQNAAATPAASGEPYPGYDRTNVSDLIHGLHAHTQEELAYIEDYERSHQNRKKVMLKLHYLRNSHEPWQNYDAMPQEEIIDRLANADDPTIKAVRDYEHKFRNRPAIIEVAMDYHHKRMANMPPREVPAYQPGGGDRSNA